MDESNQPVNRIDVEFNYETFEFEITLTTDKMRAKLISYNIDDIKKLLAESVGSSLLLCKMPNECDS